MADISAKQVKELRERTGAGMMECKKALVEANGNIEEAAVVLRKRGIAVAAKKADRAASEGLITSYIHAGGKLGVLLELNCESDFVARTDDFQELARDVAMHVAAADPKGTQTARKIAPALSATWNAFNSTLLPDGAPFNDPVRSRRARAARFREAAPPPGCRAVTASMLTSANPPSSNSALVVTSGGGSRRRWRNSVSGIHCGCRMSARIDMAREPLTCVVFIARSRPAGGRVRPLRPR